MPSDDPVYDQWVICRGLDTDATEHSIRAALLGSPKNVLVAKTRDHAALCAGFCWLLYGTPKEAFAEIQATRHDELRITHS